MGNAEIVVVTKENDNYFLYEYEGAAGNGKPNEKTDAGSWILDSSEMVGGELTVSISRSLTTTGCGICKDVSTSKHILWAAGPSYPTTPSSIGYHGGNRGSMGSHVIAQPTTAAPTSAPTTTLTTIPNTTPTSTPATTPTTVPTTIDITDTSVTETTGSPPATTSSAMKLLASTVILLAGFAF